MNATKNNSYNPAIKHFKRLLRFMLEQGRITLDAKRYIDGIWRTDLKFAGDVLTEAANDATKKGVKTIDDKHVRAARRLLESTRNMELQR